MVDFEDIAAARKIDKTAETLVAGDNIQKLLLEPEELTPMAVLLASEEGSGITGQESVLMAASRAEAGP